MAKGKLIEQLDDAVEAMMAKPDASLPTSDPRLAAILRIAGELRDLPRADFRNRLLAELAAESKQLESASSAGGKPLITNKDIEQRLKELTAQPKFIVHDVRAALSDLPEMSMRFLDSMNNHLLVASRGDKRTHWERHLGSDEMIYVIDGETDIVTLTDGGPVESTIHKGSLFVCPDGLWHRLTPRPFVSAFYLTPSRTEGSDARDPRPKRERVARRPVRRSTAAKLQEHDLRAALREAAHLNITADTTGEEADAAVRNVAKIGNLTLGVMSYTGLTPWERHPDGDELLLVLDGELEVTVLTDDGPVTRKLRAGEAFVCPQGLWHRQLAEKSVSMLYGTPIENVGKFDGGRSSRRAKGNRRGGRRSLAQHHAVPQYRGRRQRRRFLPARVWRDRADARRGAQRNRQPCDAQDGRHDRDAFRPDLGRRTTERREPSHALATLVRRLAGPDVHLRGGRRRSCEACDRQRRQGDRPGREPRLGRSMRRNRGSLRPHLVRRHAAEGCPAQRYEIVMNLEIQTW